MTLFQLSSLTFSLIFLVCPLGSFADSAGCKSNDVSATLGPVRDQGNSNFCYAFSAADLLTEAMSLKNGDQVSAFHLLADNINLSASNLEKIKSNIDFKVENPGENWHHQIQGRLFPGVPATERHMGYTAIAAGMALETGKVCLESEVPSQGSSGDDSFLLKTIEKSAYNFSSRDACNGSGFDLKWSVANIKKLDEALRDEQALRVKAHANNMCKSPLVPNKMKVHLKEYGRLDYKEGKILGKTNLPDEQITKDLRSLLCLNRPVGIAYNACVAWDCLESQNFGHAATVVGFRTNEVGDVEFKVRDSYGPKCKKLKPGIKCEDGHYWVPASLLSNNINNTIWIEK